MIEVVVPSLISGGLALVGVIITSLSNKNKIINDIDKKNTAMINEVKEENTKVINEVKLEVTKKQAITDTKIEELTREVREHNNFAKRMPVVENEIVHIKDNINKYHK